MKCNGRLTSIGSDWYHWTDLGIPGHVALKFFQTDMCAVVRVRGLCNPELCQRIIKEVKQNQKDSNIGWLRASIRRITNLRAVHPKMEEEACPPSYQSLLQEN